MEDVGRLRTVSFLFYFTRLAIIHRRLGFLLRVTGNTICGKRKKRAIKRNVFEHMSFIISLFSAIILLEMQIVIIIF